MTPPLADRAGIEFRRQPDGEFLLIAEQFLPQSREQVFAFFSDAFQLEALTPPWLNFAVLTPAPIRLGQGSLIDYRLRLHGIPLRWQSQIAVWEPPVRFVDVQTRGPYRRWRHEHSFLESGGGTLCRDVVHYAVYGGRLVERLLVRPDLVRIFGYRRARLQELLAANPRSR
jgi:ligand-binding SRPBCC domain-containing protein